MRSGVNLSNKNLFLITKFNQEEKTCLSLIFAKIFIQATVVFCGTEVTVALAVVVTIAFTSNNAGISKILKT